MSARDRLLLDGALALAEGTRFGAIVLRHGRVTATAFGGGFDAAERFEIGSIRKSVFSALLGQALAEDRVALDANAAALWPELVAIGHDKDRATTLHHLASSVSGWLTPDPPGLRFVYNNAAFTAAERVLASALGLPRRELAPLARERVQARLGLDSWSIDHWALDFDPQRFETPGPKLAIWSHLPDLARWGRVWIEGGSGPGGTVVPADHIERATRRANPHLAEAPYGYCFYVNEGEALWPGVPASAFGHGGFGSFADGTRSRALLFMCPSLGLVLAMVGVDGIGLARKDTRDLVLPQLAALMRNLVDA